MLSYLLIAPSPTCQHGNRKLHRRQLPRNLSPVFRIMKRHPAPAERNHPFRDTLIRLRIPIPDTSLDQPPQKPMMLNKRLQKPIHLRQLPAPEHLLLRLLLMLSVYRTHRHHTMDIRHTDRIRPLRHKQSSLTHPISTPYLPVKISMVSHHIRGKKPQPLRKHPAVLPKSRHPIRRQMKQNRPHIPRQKTGRIKDWIPSIPRLAAATFPSVRLEYPYKIHAESRSSITLLDRYPLVISQHSSARPVK